MLFMDLVVILWLRVEGMKDDSCVTDLLSSGSNGGTRIGEWWLVNEQQGQQSSQVDAGKVFVQEVELPIWWSQLKSNLKL